MTRGALLFALAIALAACEAPTADAGIDRETFVATYVDLRRATVDGRLDESVRDSILAARGTTQEELRAFLTSREDDPQAVADAWREINETLTAPPDTADADSAGAADSVAGSR